MRERSPMKKLLTLPLCSLLACSQLKAEDRSEVSERLSNAAVVLKEIANIPDKGIPKDLLDKCTCVAVIPSMKKGGFVVGGNYGKGAISCRTKNGVGPWSSPSMLLIGGGSFGL